MRHFLYMLLIPFSFFTHGQADWNWPDDQKMFNLAQEKQAFYKVSIQLDNYQDAFDAVLWLYRNNPNLNPSIYIDGVKIIENLLESELPQNRRLSLEDSLLWMYDQRILLFGDAASVTDRKAYSAFKLYYKTPAKFPLLQDIYTKAFELNGSAVSTFNLTPYMTLAKFHYQANPNKCPAETVIDIHDKVTSIIEQKINLQLEDEAKMKKEQDKVDALLSSIEGLLTCEFIAQKLVPRFDANPSDISIAKKIFNYSIKARCTDQPYFTKAGEMVYDLEPNYKLAFALGNKYLAAGDHQKAQQYLTRSLELSKNVDERYETTISLAMVSTKTGNKNKARQFAYEALSIKPGDKTAYNTIGNLYFTSYDDCKKNESKVLDRLVFIAAYEKYKLAGNMEQMAAAKSQFPSIEEIFNEGMEEGQELVCNCWVNETVKLQRRD